MQAFAMTKPHHTVRLDYTHIEETSQILSRAFRGRPMTEIGERLPRSFVRSFIGRADSSSFVAVEEGRVVGFLLGSHSAANHRRDFLRRCWPAVLQDLPRTVFRSPAVAGRILGRGLTWAVRHRASPPPTSAMPLPDASLILMAVDPDYRGRGAARDLVTTFLNDLAWRGVPAVKLAVDADNPTALELYRSLGWKIASRHRSPGEPMTFRMVREVPTPVPAPPAPDLVRPEFVPPAGDEEQTYL